MTDVQADHSQSLDKSKAYMAYSMFQFVAITIIVDVDVAVVIIISSKAVTMVPFTSICGLKSFWAFKDHLQRQDNLINLMIAGHNISSLVIISIIPTINSIK